MLGYQCPLDAAFLEKIGDTISCHALSSGVHSRTPSRMWSTFSCVQESTTWGALGCLSTRGAGGAWTALAAIVCDTPTKHVATGVVWQAFRDTVGGLLCWCVKLAGYQSDSPKLLKTPSNEYYEGQTPFLTVLVRSSIAMTMSRHPSPKPLAHGRRKSFLLMSLKCRWSQNIVELVVPPNFFPRCEQGNCLRTTPSTILETTANLEPHLGKHIPLEKVLWPSPSVPIVEPIESRH